MTWQGPAFTPVTITSIASRIRYGNIIVLLGSCFTEHIAHRLSALKYHVNQNPFGILYNPISIANAIRRINKLKYYTAEELVYHNGLYHSMDHHGSFSGPDADHVLTKINQSITEAHAALARADFVFISPGTSFVYEYLPASSICGNCHKIPQSHFRKYMLTQEAIKASFEQMRTDLRSMAPAASIIWTLSPVRHLSEGLVANQRSKSQLITAITSILSAHNEDAYFPAYEIMIDQLRDYRYYDRDMVHPSPEAVAIIWEMFKEAYIDEGDWPLQALVEKLNRAMTHRFLHDQPEARQKFARSQLDLIASAEHQLPTVSFDIEKKYFTSMIPGL